MNSQSQPIRFLAAYQGQRPPAPRWFEEALENQPERTFFRSGGANLELLTWGRIGAPKSHKDHILFGSLAEGLARFRLSPPQDCGNDFIGDYISGRHTGRVHSQRRTPRAYRPTPGPDQQPAHAADYLAALN